MTNNNPPICLKIRGGVEVDSYGKKAGKGALLSENLSMTLGVSQDQYLFQPIVINEIGGQGERARQTDVAPTLKAAHYKFPPSVCYSIEPVAYGVVTKGNGDAFLNEKTHTSLSVGGGQAGQGYPCVLQAFGLQPIFFEAYQHHGWRQNNVAGTLTAGQNDRVRGDTPIIVSETVGAYRITDMTNLICLEGNGQTFAMQGFGDYKQSDKASGVKARDYKDSTDLCVLQIQEADDNGKPVRC